MKTGLFNFSGFGRRISTGLRGIVAAFHAVSARMTLALVSMALIGGMVSCTFDDTDLQNSIDDLTSRVEALEDFQEQVQGDIASLQDIRRRQLDHQLLGRHINNHPQRAGRRGWPHPSFNNRC